MSSPKEYVYITGCDSGFGRIAVDLFDKQGMGVFAGVFFPQSVDKLRQECPSGRVVPIQVNVTNEGSVLEAAKQIREHLAANGGAKLAAVVNNAGILVQPCPTEWQSMKDFRDMFEVNVIGMACVTQSVLPLIRASQGRIVCTSSIAGRVGLPTESAYCASKYAVQGYCDTLRRDMIPWNVTVSIVEPGVFPNTGLYERFEKGLDAVWERLDPAIKEDYGAEHYQYVRRALTGALTEFGSSDSSLVSKAYLHAVTAPQPKYRYRVGTDSKFIITPLSHLHESTQDMVLTIDNPKNPTVKPAKAPHNGRALAMGRMDKGWKQFIATVLLAVFVLYKLRK